MIVRRKSHVSDIAFGDVRHVPETRYGESFIVCVDRMSKSMMLCQIFLHEFKFVHFLGFLRL